MSHVTLPVIFEPRTRLAQVVLAFLMIGGHLATLKKIWVECDGGLFGPSVHFVEITGVDVQTGRARSERIKG